VGIYSRALAPSEIQAIHNAGSAGKCFTPQSPAIVSQPQSRTVTAGDNVSFSVTASGTPPLSYQWLFDGDPIVGAISATLALNNAQPSQAGDYSVIVTNLYGSETSATAVLSVVVPPFTE